MFKRKIQYEVVPAGDYNDFSDRYEQEEPTKRTNAMFGVGIAATASLATYAVTSYANPTIPTAVVSPTSIPPVLEPLNVLAHDPTIPVTMLTNPEMIQTGMIAESSLNVLTMALDPVIQILVAISFPIASVIMIGSCFYFMFGKSEKAWGNIMAAGLGYILLQMSPLFLGILKEIGRAI